MNNLAAAPQPLVAPIAVLRQVSPCGRIYRRLPNPRALGLREPALNRG